MQTDTFNRLRDWYQKTDRQLLITGLKGVGKTYAVLDFAAQFAKHYIYINFETDTAAVEIFEHIAKTGASRTKAESDMLHTESDMFHTEGVTATSGHTYLADLYDAVMAYIGAASLSADELIILDETAFCGCLGDLISRTTFSALKSRVVLIDSYASEASCWFSRQGNEDSSRFTRRGNEDSRNFLHKDIENFDIISVYPMHFGEYLTAIDKQWYVDVIRGHFEKHRPVPAMIHEELLDMFDEYMQLGGMPGVIDEYIRTGRFENADESRRAILNSQCGNFANNLNEPYIDSKMQDILRALPLQFIRQNRHFRFNTIRKGVAYKQYEQSINALTERGMIYKCLKLNQHQGQEEDGRIIPGTEGEDSRNAFRIYPADFGILKTCIKMAGGTEPAILENALTASYCAQTLSRRYDELFYWESDGAAYVDFCIFKPNTGLCPIGINTALGSRKRSLKIYDSNFDPQQIFTISEENFSSKNKYLNIPLYAVHEL